MAGKIPGPEGGQTNSSDVSWVSPARPALGSSNGKPASACDADTIKSVAEALAATFHVDAKKLQRGIREDLAGALCVIQAGMKAEQYAPAEILEQTGYELRSVLSGVLKGLMEMLALVGITTVLGAGLGTAAGLLAGGAGALPGAVAGADFGFDVGMAILTWAGLGILVKQIGQGSEELYQTLKAGVEWAWVGKNLDGEARVAQVDKAAHQMAKAAGLLMVLVLRGILAYLLAKGAYRSTKGAIGTARTFATKGADAAADASVADLVRTIRATKFGAAFAKWIEDNWEDLKNNKKLEIEEKRSNPPVKADEVKVPGGSKLKAPSDGQLHNVDDAKVTSSGFQATRGIGALNSLSPQDAEAAEILADQGRTPDQIQQILNSGENFQVKKFNQGDPLYGFDTFGRSKPANSPYWLDQEGFNDVKSKFYDQQTGEWNRQGVKNYLALPCYNRADTICHGTVAEDNVGVSSTVGKATENISYTMPDGTVVPGSGSMPGGGTQVSPAPGSVIPAGGGQ